MKRSLSLTCGILALGATIAAAQNIVLSGGLPPVTYSGGGVQGVTPAEPAATQSSPAVCQKPVTPVRACATPAVYAAPNVIYVGPPGGYQANYYSPYGYGGVCGSYLNHRYYPNVIYFGRYESYYRGYQFGRCR